MSRPTGVVPIIATDDTYPSSSWVGQIGNPPTKTIFTDGEKLTGLIPESPVFPDKLNALLNDFGQRLRDLDLARVTAWTDAAVIATSGNQPGMLSHSYWQQDKRVIYAGSDQLYSSTDGGYSWQSEYASVGATFFDLCASSRPSNCAVLEIGGAGYYAKTGTAGAWLDHALTGAVQARIVRSGPASGGYIIGGERSGTTAGIWTIHDVAGEVPGAETTQHPASSNAPIRAMCSGDTWNLASYFDSGAGVSTILRWALGDTISIPVAVGPGAIEPVFDLLWLPKEKFYVAVCMTASNTDAAIYTSADGITWTNIAALPGCRVSPGAACVDGSIIVVPVVRPAISPVDRFLAISTDGAFTWDLIPDPVAKTTQGALSSATHARYVGNRLGCSTYVGGGNVDVEFSLRTGAIENY